MLEFGRDRTSSGVGPCLASHLPRLASARAGGGGAPLTTHRVFARSRRYRRGRLRRARRPRFILMHLPRVVSRDLVLVLVLLELGVDVDLVAARDELRLGAREPRADRHEHCAAEPTLRGREQRL